MINNIQFNSPQFNFYTPLLPTSNEIEMDETASSASVAKTSQSPPTTEHIREFINDLFADEEKWLSILESSAHGWGFCPSDELFAHFVYCKANFSRKHPTVNS